MDATVGKEVRLDFSSVAHTEGAEMNIEGAIRALQVLCAAGERNQSVIEFCPCAACREYPQHIVVIVGEKRVTADFQIICEGLIEKVRIAFPQLGEVQEYPLGVLKAFASEDWLLKGDGESKASLGGWLI